VYRLFYDLLAIEKTTKNPNEWGRLMTHGWLAVYPLGSCLAISTKFSIEGVTAMYGDFGCILKPNLNELNSIKVELE